MSNPYFSGDPNDNPYSSPQSGGGGNTPDRQAPSHVMAPAIGMMVMAGLSIAFSIFGVAMRLFQGPQPVPPEIANNPQLDALEQWLEFSQSPAMLASNAFGILANIVVIFGALQMMKLRNWPLAVASSVIVMLPCFSCCCLIGLGIGIWSLVVLNSADVKPRFR